MIEPTQITNFSRTRGELELFWIFCICVAGKNSDCAARAISRLMRYDHSRPFKAIAEWVEDNTLHNALVAAKVGQYTRISRALTESLGLDLFTCTLEDLMAIHGVGPKTARFFLLHTREDCDYAVLDTHILRYLKTECGFSECPIVTPHNREQYERWEKCFIAVVRNTFGGLPLAQVDLLIWKMMSGR